MRGIVVIAMFTVILVMVWLFYGGYNKAEMSLSKPAKASEIVESKSTYKGIDSFVKDGVTDEREFTVFCRVGIDDTYRCSALLEYHLKDLKVSFQKRGKSLGEALSIAEKHISDNF